MKETRLYTYREVAHLLGLLSPSGVQARMVSLEKRGLGLTVEAGELAWHGNRRVITELGLRKLREFIPAKAGRPVKCGVFAEMTKAPQRV